MFDIGDPVPLGVEIRDALGVLADPDALTVTVTMPDGTAASGTWTAGATSGTIGITRTSVGMFAAVYAPTVEGLHPVRWASTGANAAAFTDSFTVASASGVAPVSVAEVRAALGLTSTSDDEIRDLAATATQLVEDHTGRTWRRVVVTETHDGGREAVVLRRTPVQSVTAVTEAGTALTSGDWLLDTDAGILHRGTWGGGTWSRYPRSVVVTYVAGPAVVPSTIRQAVIDLCRHIWHRHLTSSSSGRYGATDEIPDTGWLLPMHVRQSLDGYRAPGIA